MTGRSYTETPPNATGAKRWDAFSKAVADFIMPMVDRHDWGYRHTDGRPRHATTTARWNDYSAGEPGYPPARLSKPRLHQHLLGNGKVYVKPSGDAWCALVMLDIDAHDGESDAGEAATWIIDTYLNGAYHEPSARGWHGYILFERGNCSITDANELFGQLESALRVLCVRQGFTSQPEVKGTFSTFADTVVVDGTTMHTRRRKAWRRGFVVQRGSLASFPQFPCGWDDLARLQQSPIHSPNDLRKIIADAGQTKPAKENKDNPIQEYVLKSQTSNSGDAFERMKHCGIRLAIELGRPPEPAELCDAYGRLHGGDCDAGRLGRVKDVCGYIRRTFDSGKLPKPIAGYSAAKGGLLKAVDAYCGDSIFDAPGKRTSGHYVKWKGKITRDHFAVALYCVTQLAFTREPDAEHQWTVGNDTLTGMYRTLRESGDYHGSIPGRSMVVAIKELLQIAGLIDCFDSQWRHPSLGQAAQGIRGICKKFIPGKQHPRYTEFLRFAETVEVVKIRDTYGQLIVGPMAERVDAPSLTAFIRSENSKSAI